MLACFHIGHWYLYFGKMSIHILCLSFNQIFSIELYEFLKYLLDISPLLGYMIEMGEITVISCFFILFF